jgi:hypothetical protein
LNGNGDRKTNLDFVSDIVVGPFNGKKLNTPPSSPNENVYESKKKSDSTL